MRRQQGLVPYHSSSLPPQEYVDAEPETASMRRQVKRQSLLPGLHAASWTGMLVVSFVLIFVLIVLGLVIHRFWDATSWGVLFLILCSIGFAILFMVRKGALWMAEIRHAWKRADVLPVHNTDSKTVAAIVQDGRVEWSPQPLWPNLQTISFSRSEAQRPALATSDLPELPPLPMKADTLPRAQPWEAIEPEIGPNRFYLGETAQGALFVPLDGVITLVNIGPQGLGKTTLTRSLALQMVMTGGDLAICDWYSDVAAEMGAFFPQCYSEPEDCEAFAGDLLIPEMTRRHAAYKQGERTFTPILWLIDEWGMLKKDCPTMAEALANALTVWRKLNLRTVISSVQIDARDLGVSKSAVSTVALFSANENLAKTWGLSGIKPELDRLFMAGRGYCLISSQTLQRQAELIALPDVSPACFSETISRRRPELMQARNSPTGESGESPTPVTIRPSPNSPSPRGAKMTLMKWERDFIALRYRKGAQRTEIRDELREMRSDGFDNRLWPELKNICDQIDQEARSNA